MAKFIIILKGGPTSGNYHHAGRPGMIGGSASSGAATASVSEVTSRMTKSSNQALIEKHWDFIAKDMNELDGDYSQYDASAWGSLVGDTLPIVEGPLKGMPVVIGSYYGKPTKDANGRWVMKPEDRKGYIAQLKYKANAREMAIQRKLKVEAHPDIDSPNSYRGNVPGGYIKVSFAEIHGAEAAKWPIGQYKI